MNIGQENDTRPYRRLRKTDYYNAKAAFEALKHEPKRFPRCKNCKQPITGKNWNGYDLRCFNEPL